MPKVLVIHIHLHQEHWKPIRYSSLFHSLGQRHRFHIRHLRQQLRKRELPHARVADQCCAGESHPASDVATFRGLIVVYQIALNPPMREWNRDVNTLFNRWLPAFSYVFCDFCCSIGPQLKKSTSGWRETKTRAAHTARVFFWK